jgi:hypothetical protein
MADQGAPHIDLMELTFEARLAVCALILGVGGLIKQSSTPELTTAAHYLQQAGAAIDAAEALLSLKPLPLAPLLSVVEELPQNVVAFTQGRRRWDGAKNVSSF